MAKPLVIVESPAKAKTLGRFLGRQYNVVASFGHIRDLPESASQVPATIKGKEWGRLGVDVEGSFTPYYVVPADKKRHVQALKTALKDASEVLLATDPDREGESISWHLKEVLRPSVPIRRIVFHEITEAAVREAMAHAGTIDEKLVDAQEARRILDRLYGYTLSPVLWKKVQTGLSAGRVQSVAVRLIVEREEARRRFRTARYWDLEARLAGQGRAFVARLVRIGDRKVATGQDFDAQGQLTTGNVHHVDEAHARDLAPRLRQHLPWSVSRVDARPGVERPAPPFTTSTLTQEAARKLGFSTKRTMDVAQRLFQGVEVGGGQMEGLITYHRTDSTTLSEKALHEAERYIRERFGPEYYEGPRRYQTRVKNAQEAHEAIRPTDFALAPQQLQGVLEPDEWKLYDLVWKRTMASQMADARVVRTTVDITAAGDGGTPHVFSASGKAIEFAGFRRAYVEGSDDPDAELEDQETLLPRLTAGDRVVADGTEGALTLGGLEPVAHETQAPPRYTEASLIKELEKAGIGRPSTYAPTIETIISRGYVVRHRNTLVPSFTAFAVTTLLREHFSDYVDVGFTAEMEEDLDEISNGDRDRLQFLRQFFLDGDGKHPGLEPKVKSVADQVAYPAVDIGQCPATNEPLRVRIGRFGPFLQRGSGGPGNTASVPEDITPADLTVERALELLKAKAAGPRALGVDPQTGATVSINNGRFGPYVQLGDAPEDGKKGQKPKRASLLSYQREDTITLAEALRLLELPRTIGLHPDDGQPVVASPGRFGPYVKHGSEFRSLASDDQIFSITLDEAVGLLRQPKRSRQRQAVVRRVLRELGVHPTSGKPVQMLDGRYGPYVTDGETNASVPKGVAPEAFTLDDAVALLASRAEAGPARKRPARRPVRAVRTARASGPAKRPRKKTAS
jgi:DNA topoisomerase-1